MADDNLVMNAVVFGAVVTVGLFVSLRNSPWDQVLTSIDISFLKKYSSGARPPPDAKKMKGKSFLEIIDHSVHVAHDSMGGLGLRFLGGLKSYFKDEVWDAPLTPILAKFMLLSVSRAMPC